MKKILFQKGAEENRDSRLHSEDMQRCLDIFRVSSCEVRELWPLGCYVLQCWVKNRLKVSTLMLCLLTTNRVSHLPNFIQTGSSESFPNWASTFELQHSSLYCPILARILLIQFIQNPPASIFNYPPYLIGFFICHHSLGDV